jgi:hypothetical protein
MPNVKVTFDRIDVLGDGEAFEDGKVYWKLSVNGSVVEELSASNPRKVSSGEVIDLENSRSVELDNNQELVVSGFLAERDSGPSGKDEMLTIDRSYDRSQNWGDGKQRVDRADKKFHCVLHYTIQVE